jgi:hypothetical protein
MGSFSKAEEKQITGDKITQSYPVVYPVNILNGIVHKTSSFWFYSEE